MSSNQQDKSQGEGTPSPDQPAGAGAVSGHGTSGMIASEWAFPRVWGSGLILLIAASFPLWFPGVSPTMPLVPLLPWLPANSIILDYCANAVSIVLLGSLLLAVTRPRRFRRCWWLVAGSLFLSFVLDQHRLQPWAYQSAIYALVFASFNRATATRWLIPLAASVYIYSSAGKFDYQFAHTVGQDFIEATSMLFGGIPIDLDGETRSRLAFAFPAVEFAAGIGLLFPRTRRLASVVVMAMHLCLLALLGPWNRDHSWGVLLWNLLLLTQAYLLFFRTGRMKAIDRATDSSKTPLVDQATARASSWSGTLVCICVIAAMTAPLLERRGLWDHWTSWSLYSPHTSHLDVELHVSTLDGLPPDVVASLQEDTNKDGWRLLNVGQWSLESRWVPVYPQARYQLGLTIALANRHGVDEEIRARLSGVSDRWTGKRSLNMMRGRQELEQAAERFWLLPSQSGK